MNYIELVGIVATIFILISMSFKTTSFKGNLWMRVLNIIGSIIFVIYGILMPALSTAILNGAVIIINSYHIYILLKSNKKGRKK